jgi:hypothetical protein
MRQISSLSLTLLTPLLAIAGLACRPEAQRMADGRDPLASLQAPVASEVYDLAFWAREERGATALWQAARKFCGTHPEASYPGCRNVRMASWWGTPPPPPSPPASAFLPADPLRAPARVLPPPRTNGGTQ